jgi:hypothetical protein
MKLIEIPGSRWFAVAPSGVAPDALDAWHGTGVRPGDLIVVAATDRTTWSLCICVHADAERTAVRLLHRVDGCPSVACGELPRGFAIERVAGGYALRRESDGTLMINGDRPWAQPEDVFAAFFAP